MLQKVFAILARMEMAKLISLICQGFPWAMQNWALASGGDGGLNTKYFVSHQQQEWELERERESGC